MSSNSRRVLLGFLVLLLVVPAIGCKTRRTRRTTSSTPAPFASWKSVSPDGLFTVMMPNDPVPDRQVLHNRERVSYASHTRNEYYRVTVFVTPDDARAAKIAASKDSLKAYADTWAKTGQTEVKVDGQPGLEVKWNDAATKHNYRGRVTMSPDGHLVYLVRARWTGANEPANVAQFLDSFKIGKYTPKPGASPSAAPSAAPSTAPSAAPSAAPSGEASPGEDESGSPDDDSSGEDVKDKPDASDASGDASGGDEGGDE